MLDVLTYLFYLLSKPNIPVCLLYGGYPLFVLFVGYPFIYVVYCIFAFSVRLKVMRSTAPNAQMSKNQIPSPRGTLGKSGIGVPPGITGTTLRLPEGVVEEDDAYGSLLLTLIFSAAKGTV